MSVQHIWNLFQLLGLKCANTIPKLPGVDYVAKNWALAMMLKALPLVHFWGVLLLKEQMITSVRKTFKMLVSDWFLAKFALKITTKSAIFYRLLFGEVCPENSCEIGRFFRKFVPKNPTKIDFFFCDLSEALIQGAYMTRDSLPRFSTPPKSKSKGPGGTNHSKSTASILKKMILRQIKNFKHWSLPHLSWQWCDTGIGFPRNHHFSEETNFHQVFLVSATMQPGQIFHQCQDSSNALEGEGQMALHSQV